MIDSRPRSVVFTFFTYLTL